MLDLAFLSLKAIPTFSIFCPANFRSYCGGESPSVLKPTKTGEYCLGASGLGILTESCQILGDWIPVILHNLFGQPELPGKAIALNDYMKTLDVSVTKDRG